MPNDWRPIGENVFMFILFVSASAALLSGAVAAVKAAIDFALS